MKRSRFWREFFILSILLVSCGRTKTDIPAGRTNTGEPQGNSSEVKFNLPNQENGNPQKHFLMIGGNCENPKHKNMFAMNFINTGQVFRLAGWQTEALYGDKYHRCKTLEDCPSGVTRPHVQDTAEVAKAFGVSIADLKISNKTNLYASLEGLGALPRQSEILISIDTHGIPPMGQGDSHSVCIGGELLSLREPQFIKRLEALKERGLKLAFTDASCFSGGAVTALEPLGCVLTSQASNRTAIDGYTKAFAKAFEVSHQAQKTSNMTDLFLAQILTATSEQAPMISGLSESNEVALYTARFLTSPPFSTSLWSSEDMVTNFPLIQIAEKIFPPSSQPWALYEALEKDILGFMSTHHEEAWLKVHRIFTARSVFEVSPAYTFLPSYDILSRDLNQAVAELKRGALNGIPETTEALLEREKLLKHLSAVQIDINVDLASILTKDEADQINDKKLLKFANGSLDCHRGIKWEMSIHSPKKIHVKMPFICLVQTSKEDIYTDTKSSGLAGGMRKSMATLVSTMSNELLTSGKISLSLDRKEKISMQLVEQIYTQLEKRFTSEELTKLRNASYRFELLSARRNSPPDFLQIWPLALGTRYLQALSLIKKSWSLSAGKENNDNLLSCLTFDLF